MLDFGLGGIDGKIEQNDVNGGESPGHGKAETCHETQASEVIQEPLPLKPRTLVKNRSFQ